MSEQGDIKYDPRTGAVAIRTNQPEQSPDGIAPSLAWLIATTTSGAQFAAPAVVADWLDIEVPGQ